MRWNEFRLAVTLAVTETEALVLVRDSSTYVAVADAFWASWHGRWILSHAARAGWLWVLKACVVKGVDLHALELGEDRGNLRMPLRRLLSTGSNFHDKVFDWLLQQGVDVNSVVADDSSPLNLAVQLMAYGADSRTDRRTDVVRRLLENGPNSADPNVPDNVSYHKGLLPIEHALGRGPWATVELLVQRGATVPARIHGYYLDLEPGDEGYLELGAEDDDYPARLAKARAYAKQLNRERVLALAAADKNKTQTPSGLKALAGAGPHGPLVIVLSMLLG